MSFYGDMTNTSRTHFQFDRIYANRAEMEQYKENDGIYAGRFVLIEYDNEMHMDSFLRVRKDGNNFYTTFSEDTSKEVLLTKGKIHPGTIVYTSAYETLPANGYYAKNCTFYKCTSEYIQDSEELATFEDIVGEGELNPHITNYSIDSRVYGRGYDSTVWQKVYDGGIEKYMMVAELNTVIPTFDLQPDAPTQTPIVPHFDIQGSDIYYKLHHQPTWGFRVKSANPESGPEFKNNGELLYGENIPYTSSYPEEGYPSDETTEWIRTEYNPDTGYLTTLYWHSGNDENGLGAGRWRTYPPREKMPAAIYFNKAGFDPEIITKSSLEDHITIEGTGISGHQYSSHDSVGTETSYPDIQELSMMLPSIGNSISAMWDIVYGDESMSTKQTEDGKIKRNLDIDWDSVEGLRLVSNKKDGNGFEYNTEQVSTLAGAINSVHDLMGMIIVNPTEPMDNTFALGAEDNKIYYSDGNYYHRVNEYEYDVENAISAVDADRILTDDEIKNISYKLVDYPFEAFPPIDDNFYYGTAGQSYKLETANYPTYNRVYYATKDKGPFFTKVTPVQFVRDKHYKFVSDGATHSYQENGETVTVNLGYFINSDSVPANGIDYYEILPEEISEVEGIPYIPNTYYIYNVGENVGAEIGSIEGAIELKDIVISTGPFNANYTYYTALIENGELTLEKANVFGVTKDHYYLDLSNNRYYRCSKEYIPHQTEVLSDLSRYKFVTFSEQTPVDYFYIPNKYYTYNNDTKEYRIYGEEKWDTTLDYYIRTDINNIREVDLVKEHYYVSNTYYYQLANKKMVIDRNKIASDVDYYLRDKILYVYQDANDVMNIGMEWNVNVKTIPKGITITTRREVPTMKKLDGFARELNTIHGLILEINRLLLTNDIHTRDAYTIQGVINIVNDIIDKFEIIAPGQFVIVDDYGRIHSATHSEDDWIDIEINSDVLEPNVSITHKFNPVNNTKSSSNQNTDDSDGNIELYTPKVDACGHIVGENIETIELPHSFKTLSYGDNNTLVAKNHIATLNLKDDNWLQFSLNDSTSTLSLEHSNAQSVTNTINIGEARTFNFGDTINIPSISYDAKGHIASTTTIGATLPILTVEADNASDGMILTKVDSSGTKLRNRSLVGITLNGYTGQTNLFKSNETLGKALNEISVSISNLQTSITDLQKSIISLQTRVSALESAAK